MLIASLSVVHLYFESHQHLPHQPSTLMSGFRFDSHVEGACADSAFLYLNPIRTFRANNSENALDRTILRSLLFSASYILNRNLLSSIKMLSDHISKADSQADSQSASSELFFFFF
jgi:hypothetical protein